MITVIDLVLQLRLEQETKLFASKNISVDVVVIVDTDADMTTEIDILNKMQVKIVRSDERRNWLSNKKNIRCMVDDIDNQPNLYQFFAANMLKMTVSCLNYSSVMFSDIDNFAFDMTEDAFKILSQRSELMFGSGAGSTPFSGGYFIVKPTKSSCQSLSSLMHTPFSLESGWNNSNYRIPRWRQCSATPHLQKVLNFHCDSGLWNFFGSCADQGALYHEYSARLNSSDLSGRITSKIQNTHYYGTKKPWNKWHGQHDLLWWKIWSDFVSHNPEVTNLKCYKSVEVTKVKIAKIGNEVTKESNNINPLK
jgi:hypothetical protein